MLTVRLRVKSNAGIVAMSSSHPDATFTIRGAWPDGDALRLLVETADVEPGDLRETLDRISAVHDLRRRSAGSDVARFEIATAVPEPHGVMAASGVVPSFPQTVTNGWIVDELTTSREQLVAFRDELDDAGIEYRVESVRTDREPELDRLLTERQREAVELAFDLGYYDYPRECTLTELAEALGVATSVASRLLQRAEGRIVEAFLR